MSDLISREICRAADEYSLPLTALSPEQLSEIWTELFDAYGLDPRHFSIHLKGAHESFHDPAGWQLISEYVGQRNISLLLPEAADDSGWLVADGPSLRTLLENTFGFAFIVTSTDRTFLLAFDDHDCLIGAGEAAAWVRSLREARSCGEFH